MKILPQRSRAALPLALAVLAAPTVFAQQAPAPPAWPTPEWALSTPQAEGLDAAVLADLVDHLATPSLQTDSVLLVRHGRIVLEGYAAPYRAGLRHDLRSVTKSAVATLVGAAIQEGRIASDAEKVLAWFPGRTANGPGQAAMTLRHLLDMTSGIQWKEWPYGPDSDAYKLWAAPDWAGFILSRPVAQPGEKFDYMAAAPHLLSVVLTRATGANAADYARRGVFKAIGIGDFAWRANAQGDSIGESSLMLAPRDMARLGLLHLRGGAWEGRQLLPPGWTAALFDAPGVPQHGALNSPPTYRSFWWTDAAVPYASAIGRHGQFIVVLPRQDLLLVVTSKTHDRARPASVPELVRKFLLPAAAPEAPGADPGAAREKLARSLARFAQGRAQASAAPSAAALAQLGRSFRFEPNAWDYREFTLELGPSPSYRILQGEPRATFGVATRGGAFNADGSWLESERAGDKLWARRGRWVDESTFRVETQHLESAISAEWTARFLSDGTLELLYADGDGEVRQLKGRPKE